MHSDLSIGYITAGEAGAAHCLVLKPQNRQYIILYAHCGHFNHKLDSEEQHQLVSSKISSCLMQISSCFSLLMGGSRSRSSCNRPAGQWDPSLTPFYSRVGAKSLEGYITKCTCLYIHVCES